MKINLWFCIEMNQWRWTLTDDSRPIIKQESGQQPDLRAAINYALSTKAQSIADDLGYVPLSGSVLNKARLAVGRIGN